MPYYSDHLVGLRGKSNFHNIKSRSPIVLRSQNGGPVNLMAPVAMGAVNPSMPTLTAFSQTLAACYITGIVNSDIFAHLPCEIGK